MKRWLALGMLLLLPARGFAANYALVVGIETYQQPSIISLPGCAHDAELMRQALMDKFGFPAENIVTVLNAQATRAGIEIAFRTQLIERAQPGDAVVFYYSGHGTQVPDDNGDEADGVDEALCPTDISKKDPATWLRDDTLTEWLAQVRTEKVTVILDSCFSGTATRADDALIAKFADLGFRPTRAAGKVAFFEKQAANHVLLSAGTDAQVSYMLKDDSRKGSVFTAFLFNVLTSVAADATYDVIMNQVAPQVREYVARHFPDREQTPQLEGDGSAPAFFGTSAAPADIENRRDFRVSVSLNQELYFENDLMTVTVEAERDCYIRIYVMNAERQTKQLFPNQWQQENAVKGGQSINIPGENAPFILEMGAPFGKETIRVVASAAQFSDLKTFDYQGQPFPDFGEEPLSQTTTRGVNVRPAPNQPAVSVATVKYEIRPR